MKLYELQTVIDGTPYKLIGKLSKDGKALIMHKGVKCSIMPTDTLTEIQKPAKPAKQKTAVRCPFDLHKWFNSQPKNRSHV